MLQELYHPFATLDRFPRESLLQLVSRSQVNFLDIFISTPLGVLLCSKPKPREQTQGQDICISLGFHLFPHAWGYWLQLCAYKIRLLCIVSSSALPLGSAAFHVLRNANTRALLKGDWVAAGAGGNAWASASHFESGPWQIANKHCYHLMVAWGSEFRCCKCSSPKKTPHHSPLHQGAPCWQLPGLQQERFPDLCFISSSSHMTLRKTGSVDEQN